MICFSLSSLSTSWAVYGAKAEFDANRKKLIVSLQLIMSYEMNEKGRNNNK